MEKLRLREISTARLPPLSQDVGPGTGNQQVTPEQPLSSAPETGCQNAGRRANPGPPEQCELAQSPAPHPGGLF